MSDKVFFVNNNYLGSIFMTRLVTPDVTKLIIDSFIYGLYVLIVLSSGVDHSMVIHLCVVLVDQYCWYQPFYVTKTLSERAPATLYVGIGPVYSVLGFFDTHEIHIRHAQNLILIAEMESASYNTSIGINR